MGVMEDVLQQGRQASGSASAVYSTTSRKRSASVFSGSAMALGGIGVATIFVGLALVWKGLAQPAPLPLPSAPVSLPAREIPTPIPAPEPVVAAPVNLPPTFALNGIVEGVGDEPFAIINGRFVRLGGTIEGATLRELTSDSATLQWQNQDLVLYMSRAGSGSPAQHAASARSSSSTSSNPPTAELFESE